MQISTEINMLAISACFLTLYTPSNIFCAKVDFILLLPGLISCVVKRMSIVLFYGCFLRIVIQRKVVGFTCSGLEPYFLKIQF